MCIIRGPVVSVSGTKIVVAPSTDFQRQLTVYLNTVHSAQPNMMILPVPYPESVQFHTETMVYADLFKDADASIYKQNLFLTAATRSAAWTVTSTTMNPLHVQQIGHYKVSVAGSIEDLERLDTDVFGLLSPELKSMLWLTYGPEHLPVPYGFICAQLEPDLKTYEALAYSHRALSRGLFVPTKHFHDGYDTATATDWDHEVYSIATDSRESHTPRNSEDSVHYIPRPQNSVQWTRLPVAFRHTPLKPLYCWRRQGVYVNKDLLLPFENGVGAPPQDELEDPTPIPPPSPPSPTGRGLAKLLNGLSGVFK